jgi:hypothetical protein
MNAFVTLLQSDSSPEIPNMPKELSWGIIVLLALILAWVIVRYTTRIDRMLERLDDAVDAIKQNLISISGDVRNHEGRIANLENSKTSKRRP